jgi:hypothetical protein
MSKIIPNKGKFPNRKAYKNKHKIISVEAKIYYINTTTVLNNSI